MTSSTNSTAREIAAGSGFRPAWWLPGGHAQTLWRKFSGAPRVTHERERVELVDGDFIDLDWARPAGAPMREDVMVLVLHGLCGCSRSPYVLNLQAQLLARGIASVALNFRGCSGEVNRLAKAYHSGVSSDVDEVVEHLLARHPVRHFAAVGYSLGANVLLKWLGERGEEAPVARAVAVSTPFDLAGCSRAMGRGPSRIYGRYFVRRLLADFRKKQAHFATRGEQRQVRELAALGDSFGIRDIWDFDDRITAPLHGFNSAADYYRRCSSARFLASVRTQTLLIQSADDPLIPASILPGSDTLPARMHLLLTGAGGHVGFIAGSGANWLEQQIVNFVHP